MSKPSKKERERQQSSESWTIFLSGVSIGLLVGAIMAANILT